MPYSVASLRRRDPAFTRQGAFRRNLLTASALVLLAAGCSTKTEVAEATPPNVEAAPTEFVDTSPGDEIAGEILIDAKDDVSASDLADLAKIAGVPLHAASSLSDDMDKFEVADVNAADEERVLEALRADPRVEHAEPMEVFKAAFVPNDPLYERSSGT